MTEKLSSLQTLLNIIFLLNYIWPEHDIQSAHSACIISNHYIFYLKNDTVCLQSLSKWRNDRILHGSSRRICFGPDCRFLVTVAEIAAFGFIFCYFIPRDECTAFYDRYIPLPSFYYIAMWGKKERGKKTISFIFDLSPTSNL